MENTPASIDIDGITQSILPSGYLKLDLPKIFDYGLHNLENSPTHAVPRDSAKKSRSKSSQIGANLIGLITEDQRFLQTKNTISVSLHGAQRMHIFIPIVTALKFLMLRMMRLKMSYT